MKVIIKKTGINGEGIGYIDKTPVFVPGALIDEEVDIRVIERQQRYANGELQRVIRKSKDRIEPKCKQQRGCGACPLMIAKYPVQQQYKLDILKQSLIKYAQINPRLIERVIRSEDCFEYRNQFMLPFSNNEYGELASGLYMPNSNYFMEVEKCWIYEVGLERVRQDILHTLRKHQMEAYDHEAKSGMRSLIVRVFHDKFQCTLVTGDDKLSKELVHDLMNIKGMYSLWQSMQTVKKTPDVFGPKLLHLAGEKLLPLELEDVKLNISPRSFFRLNTKQALQVYRTIDTMVTGHKSLIVEAYSGIGAISLYLKDKADELIGIDNFKDAIVNANQNAKQNGCEHISYICDDAANKLTYISKKRSIDVLVVDPSRSGLDDAMINCILQSKIKEIIYISCNPATLGKNLSILNSKYRVEKIVPLDLFPHTPHMESIVKLKRLK